MIDIHKQLSALRGAALDRARLALRRGDFGAGRTALLDAKSLSHRLIELSPSSTERIRRATDHAAFVERVDADLAAIDRFELEQSDDASNTRQLDDDESAREAAIEAMRYRATTSLADVIGLDQLKRTLLLLAAMRFSSEPSTRRTRGGLLLYGPPGTGKSFIASALSNTFDRSFYNCNLSGLLSKWFGESSKTISCLFSRARKEAATIFIDEIDSIAMGRDQSSSPANRQVLCSLLSELDGLNSYTDASPLVIAATNAPWDLDTAVLSRFSRCVYVPLPEAEHRAQMIKGNLGSIDHTVRLEWIVERSVNFSGRDIKQLVDIAVENGIWRANARHFGPDADLSGVISLSPPHVLDTDFDDALKSVRPTANASLIKQYQEWSMK